MIRITTLLWIALLMVAGGTVMRVSYHVRHVQAELADIQRDTRQEQEAIRILTAEWHTLNDPHRIDALAQRYLTLQPTPIQRVVSLADIPLKPSDEQLAKAGTESVKVTKDRLQAKKPVVPPVKPAQRPAPPVVVASSPHTPSLPPSSGQSGVGVILARMERSE